MYEKTFFHLVSLLLSHLQFLFALFLGDLVTLDLDDFHLEDEDGLSGDFRGTAVLSVGPLRRNVPFCIEERNFFFKPGGPVMQGWDDEFFHSEGMNFFFRF